MPPTPEAAARARSGRRSVAVLIGVPPALGAAPPVSGAGVLWVSGVVGWRVWVCVGVVCVGGLGRRRLGRRRCRCVWCPSSASSVVSASSCVGARRGRPACSAPPSRRPRAPAASRLSTPSCSRSREVLVDRRGQVAARRRCDLRDGLRGAASQSPVGDGRLDRVELGLEVGRVARRGSGRVDAAAAGAAEPPASARTRPPRGRCGEARGACSLTVLEPLGERVGQARGADRRRRAGDVVLRAPPLGRPASVSSSSHAARGSPSRGWPTLPGLSSHSPAPDARCSPPRRVSPVAGSPSRRTNDSATCEWPISETRCGCASRHSSASSG